jgi:Uma2 family endonuclease
MSVATAQHVEYYYETHPTREDLMGDTPLHTVVVDYMDAVLDYLFRFEGWLIGRNLEMYLTDDLYETPITPDLAVFKGVRQPADVADLPRRWALGEGNMPPAVVIEIASNKTAARDQKLKPQKYARMGVGEYIFWDPRPSVRPRKSPLQGWRCGMGIPEEMPLSEHGWLWSDELESWVVPDGSFIRLYTRDGILRLKGEDAERAAKEASLAREAEALARAEAERAAKEAALARAEAESAAKEHLLALLRSHGIDPDKDGR